MTIHVPPITPYAARLLDALRNDPKTRKHFHMSNWISPSSSCRTIGCLAGTVTHYAARDEWLFSPPLGSNVCYFRTGAKLLGLSHDLARLLFHPYNWREQLRTSLNLPQYFADKSIPPSVGAEMLRFAVQPSSSSRIWAITPDEAATALEDIILGGQPYVNWQSAIEEPRFNPWDHTAAGLIGHNSRHTEAAE